MSAEFIHLHNHTEYSLLDGACRLTGEKGKPGELFNVIAKEYKMPALAITDHGNMYGAIEFYNMARKSGIKPIIGCEVYVAPKSRFDKTIDKNSDDSINYNHLTLIAKDYEGYVNLMRLVSAGFTEGFYYKPRVDKEIIRKYSKGLIALSGCLAGEISSLLLREKFAEAEKAASDYQDIFGKGNFYIEVMDHDIPEEQRIIPHLTELSKKTGIPLVATNDCHFLKKEDWETHDILLCVGMGKTQKDENRMKFSKELYYKSAEEMVKLFSYLPDALKNTLEIAEKTNIEIKTDKLFLPNYPVPQGHTPETYLQKLTEEGLKTRYGKPAPEHIARLNHELAIINKMGFASYFLIVWDFILHAKKTGVPVGPGRGSGAGSMVAYTLGITDLCPLRYDLLFERFLNPDRISMPDLDIDFADSGRDKVIEYVRNKYGQENCAQIITFGSMKSRLVIKDVARVLGFTPEWSNILSKLIPQNATIAEAISASKDLAVRVANDPDTAKVIAASQKLEGLKRHTGVHAAGMVIAKEEITNYAPLSKGSKDIITTQYEGGTIANLGLLKVDFLGLRTLTIIDECVKLIKQSKPDFNISDIPLDDPKTYKLLESAKAIGVFQLESKGMRDLMRKLKPATIDDVIALIALYRPGPMGSGMLDTFVNCKHGQQKIVYDHPLLEPILKDTYGVILYQEQVMKMSVALAGFTPGEADTLRKAMGKKIPEEMEKLRDKFVSGAHEKNKIDKKTAGKIYDNIYEFAGYGFNKSHSAAYGLVSYQTAYLKANYPLEYFTALLNSEIGRSAIKDEEESKMVAYLEDAKQFNISILPPDINKSKKLFSIEGENIRFGLLAIKNVGEAIGDELDNRAGSGGFKNFDDFLEKIDLKNTNKKALECFAKAGVFDSFGDNHLKTRAEILSSIDQSVDAALKAQKNANILELFEMDEIKKKPDVLPLDAHKALEFEKEVLGFYLSGHPLSDKQNDLKAYGRYRLDAVPLPKENADWRFAKIIRLAGMMTGIKKQISKAKKEFAKFKLEDLNGTIECIMFPKTYETFGEYLIPNSFVIVKGKLQNKEGTAELIVEEIFTLNEARQKLTPYVGVVNLTVSTAGFNDALSDTLSNLLGAHPGNNKVLMHIEDTAHGNYTLETDFQINFTPELKTEIEALGVSAELGYSGGA
jgi:DNA polymerase-3 subunit alpha